MQLDALLPYMLADAPGCPDITAKMALINAATELCAETNVWNEVLDPITLIDKVNEYELEAPADARVISVMRVTSDIGPLRASTIDQIQAGMEGWATSQSSHPDRYGFVAAGAVLRVYPIPVGAQRAKLRVRAVFAPVLGADALPDSLVQDYLETLTSGALQRVLATPGRSWSNPQLAGYHAGRFEEGKSKARIDVLHDSMRGTVTAAPQRFI